MVTLGRNMPEEDLVHELAHQWFGSSVGPPPPVNGWLDSPTTPRPYVGTGGCTVPPMTCAVVWTVRRPAATSPCRKSSSAVNFAGVMA
jgi:hypothetical protein